MVTQDTWCTVDAYFKVKPDELEAFERLADRFVEKTRYESGIRYYGWSFDGYTSTTELIGITNFLSLIKVSESPCCP